MSTETNVPSKMDAFIEDMANKSAEVCTMTDEAIVGYMYHHLTIDKWKIGQIIEEMVSPEDGIDAEKIWHCYGLLVLSGALRQS